MKFELPHDDETGSGQVDEPRPAEDDIESTAPEELVIMTPDELAQMLADETEQMNECLDTLTGIIAKESSRTRNRPAPPPASFRPARFRANPPTAS
ncbi:hypothetical protein [Actinomadura miaoliensis]|uniref:Uncharacterized protein n=1 Tax=Actinomadura miaoliensis TaxID=430685 RepID=A0ABP7V4P5_9ACTN